MVPVPAGKWESRMPNAAARRERNAVERQPCHARYSSMVNRLCAVSGRLPCLQNVLCGHHGRPQQLVMGLLYPFQTHDAAALTANAQALSVNQHLVDVANGHRYWSTLRQPAHTAGNDLGIKSLVRHFAKPDAHRLFQHFVDCVHPMTHHRTDAPTYGWIPAKQVARPYPDIGHRRGEQGHFLACVPPDRGHTVGRASHLGAPDARCIVN